MFTLLIETVNNNLIKEYMLQKFEMELKINFLAEDKNPYFLIGLIGVILIAIVGYIKQSLHFRQCYYGNYRTGCRLYNPWFWG